MLEEGNRKKEKEREVKKKTNNVNGRREGER